MSENAKPDTTPAAPSNFIRSIIEEDNRSGKWDGRVETRFPPEPNGYLHYGHAKSICLNFGLAEAYGGVCHLRFDDTNPEKEEQEYVDGIIEAVSWLGFDWGRHLYFASDYFETMYQCAVGLIQAGKAYVDSLPPDEMRRLRGTLTEPGTDSPFRNHWDLAYARCVATMDYLVKLGIDAKRIRISVAADKEPKHISPDPLLQRQNPRVEVFMLDEMVKDLEGTAAEREERYSAPPAVAPE